MNTKNVRSDARIDAYIEHAADFAQPILKYLRKTVHTACPAVEETMKWSFPHFTYRGLLCSMAAFKQHCSFGFWKGALVLPKELRKDEGMGSFGRITSLKDLPPKKQLIGYIQAAMRLNDQGAKAPAITNRKARKPLPVPSDLAAALRKNKAAKATFDDFAPSHRRDYIEWISEAKTEATRQRRMQTTLEWLAEGKARNWKYMKKRRSVRA